MCTMTMVQLLLSHIVYTNAIYSDKRYTMYRVFLSRYVITYYFAITVYYLAIAT